MCTVSVRNLRVHRCLPARDCDSHAVPTRLYSILSYLYTMRTIIIFPFVLCA